MKTETPISEEDNSGSNNQQLVVAGGRGPGLHIKFNSMHDYVEKLPYVERKFVDEAIKKCNSTKQPLPLFYSDFSSESAIMASILI